ncbi:MAG: dephospho-CoA kinase [Candidatus Brocadiae bacterium]|nr:dephospho-CoA kinase [Candidatus Brocadiia bacterium]
MQTINEFLKQKKKLFIIGLMGGVASGKSTIGKIFETLGAQLIEADSMAHRILEYKRVKESIVKLWGDSLLIKGEIDRKALGKIVFSGEKGKKSPDLIKLEKIVHPILRRRIFQRLQKLSQKNHKIVVLDVALLWENGLKDICDILVFIDTPLSLRQQRAFQNRNWEESEVILREKFQEDIEIKKQAAHFIVPNKGNMAETLQTVHVVWSKIQEMI